MDYQDNPFIHEHIQDYDDRVKAHTRTALKRALDDLNHNSTTSSTPLASGHK